MKKTQISCGIFAVFIWALIAGCSSVSDRSPEENAAVVTAKREMLKLGWKRVKIYGCIFEEGRWLVAIEKQPPKTVGTDAIVEISPEGKVIKVHNISTE